MPAGRPTKYDPKYAEEMVDYFENAPLFTEEWRVNPKTGEEYKVKLAARCPTIIRFAIKINVSHDSIVEWEKTYPEFSVAYKKAKLLQEEWLMNAAGMGFFVPSMGIMALKANHGWRDNQSVEMSGAGGDPLTVKILGYKPEQ